MRASLNDANVFALAGKEIEVSLWDVKQTFAEGAGESSKAGKAGEKRKKDDREIGEIWRAKNVSARPGLVQCD